MVLLGQKLGDLNTARDSLEDQDTTTAALFFGGKFQHRVNLLKQNLGMVQVLGQK